MVNSSTNKPPKKPQTYEIPDHIKDVPDTITNEILACTDCEKNFRIIAQELRHYRRKNIPVSRKCPDCRHRDRNKIRAPRCLFDRACSSCQKAIKSPFEISRPEKVYCEACYLKALY